jgi:hypothetical protein
MAVDHVKSTGITNLDASPPTANTAGEGASGLLREISGFATGVAASSINATYQFVRIPSPAKVKSIIFASEAQAAGAMDIGLYKATDGTGGNPTSLLAANAIDQDFFATAVALTAASAETEVVNESGTYTYDKRNMPIWQAVGLTTDPGGYFDIVGTITTAITTGTGKMWLSCRWVE